MRSPKNMLVALLAVAVIAMAWLAWRQRTELADLRAAALTRDERADWQKRLWQLEKLNRELRDQIAQQGGPAQELAPAGERPRSARGEARRELPGSFTGRERALRELMLKPEVQAILNQQQQPALDSRYAALFRTLNLPADQVDRLKTLLAERLTTVMDVMSAARDQGVDPRQNPEALRQLVGDAQNAINDSIKGLIGESGFAQLTQYEQTQPQRNVVSQLEQRLSYTSTPLTSAQSEQLVQVLARNAPAPAESPMPGAEHGGPGRGPDFGMVMNLLGSGAPPPIAVLDGGRGSGTAPITAAAVAQSQAILSPPQVQALQQIQQQQQSQQQLRQMVRETMTTSPGRTPAAPAPGSRPVGR